jgi:hypothetical protein
LRLFRPRLIQYILFWKTEQNIPFNDAIVKFNKLESQNKNIKGLEIIEDPEYILIHYSLDIKSKSDPAKTKGWAEMDFNNIKNSMTLSNRITDRFFRPIKDNMKGLKFLGTYQMVITGAEDDYWTRSKIDIHKFKIFADGRDRALELSDIEAESNLAIFNRLLFSGKTIYGDQLENLKLPTKIYGMGNSVSEEIHRLPKSYLCSITVDKGIKNDEKSEFHVKQFKLTINTVIFNFGRLIVNVAKLIDLFKDDFSNINKQSIEIREKALRLQMKINDLLVTKSDSSSGVSNPQRQLKVETEDVFPYQQMEEYLLLEASRYLSYITEINQLQARVNYTRQEATIRMDKISQSVGLAPIMLLSTPQSEIPSLSSEFKQISSSVNHNFQNLKIDLEHSQSTIRNTVDILKTFLESEQRIVSQKSSEAINWIVIVFAGLGLADALGNFVIFYLQGGKWYEAMFWFFFIMIILIVVIVVLYFWYFKRPKSLPSL